MPILPNSGASVPETGVGEDWSNVNKKPIEVGEKPATVVLPESYTIPDFCTCVMQCVPDLVVFTDEAGGDYYRNDITSVWMKSVEAGNESLSNYTFTKKIINADTGVETTLTDPTHGLYYKLQYAKWFKVSWYKVYLALGYGRYYMELKEIETTNGKTLNKVTTPIFRLQRFYNERANNTIRIEVEHHGKIHSGNDYSDLKDYVGFPVPQFYLENYVNQIRLPGRLKFTGTETENDHLVLNNDSRSTYQIKDQERPQFELLIERVSGKQVSKVLFDDLFSSPVKITDYNLFNHVVDPRNYSAARYESIPLKKNGISLLNPSTRKIRSTYKIDLIYDNDNVFKTNN